MNVLRKTMHYTVIDWLYNTGRQLLVPLLIATVAVTASCSDPDDAIVELTVDPVLGQAVFIQPDDAANAFVFAVSNDDKDMLAQILGSDYREVLSLDAVTGEDVDNFIAAWERVHTLLPEGEQKRLLAIGESEWTLPIPVVKGNTGWYFNVEEGRERMRIRSIGRNELATMQAILAYYDAQMEYAEQDRSDNGMLEYSRRFISTPGTHDGLYWDVEEGEPDSPLGPLMANDTPGGGYHGYSYRILEAQGEHARGGAYSYLLGKQMRAGFAAVAWPQEYGQSGVMTFIVSHNGLVYEQNLGEASAAVAGEMTHYDPGPQWLPTKEVNGPQAGAAE